MAVLEAAAKDPAALKRAEEAVASFEKRQISAGAASAVFEPINTFNAERQFINVTKGSKNQYVAPGPGDLRGPCPGLNAFANHSKFNRIDYATMCAY